MIFEWATFSLVEMYRLRFCERLIENGKAFLEWSAVVCVIGAVSNVNEKMLSVYIYIFI